MFNLEKCKFDNPPPQPKFERNERKKEWKNEWHTLGLFNIRDMGPPTQANNFFLTLPNVLYDWIYQNNFKAQYPMSMADILSYSELIMMSILCRFLNSFLQLVIDWGDFIQWNKGFNIKGKEKNKWFWIYLHRKSLSRFLVLIHLFMFKSFQALLVVKTGKQSIFFLGTKFWQKKIWENLFGYLS